MKYTRIFIALFVAAIASNTLFAQESTTPPPAANKTPGINERQMNQQKRIRQGVKSGQLTKKETRKLEKGEAKIQSDKLAAKSDGKVTKTERKKLHHELNRESKAIHNKKHNAVQQKAS
jgi:hypothetical protein